MYELGEHLVRSSIRAWMILNEQLRRTSPGPSKAIENDPLRSRRRNLGPRSASPDQGENSNWKSAFRRANLPCPSRRRRNSILCWREPRILSARESGEESPLIVSPKREYSRRRPETFRNFHLKFGKAGGQRRNRMREKRGFPAHARVSWEARQNAALPGWRRRDRTHAFLLEPVSAPRKWNLGIWHDVGAARGLALWDIFGS
jgi:hypothetical protein